MGFVVRRHLLLTPYHIATVSLRLLLSIMLLSFCLLSACPCTFASLSPVSFPPSSAVFYSLPALPYSLNTPVLSPSTPLLSLNIRLLSSNTPFVSLAMRFCPSRSTQTFLLNHVPLCTFLIFFLSSCVSTPSLVSSLHGKLDFDSILRSTGIGSRGAAQHRLAWWGVGRG